MEYFSSYHSIENFCKIWLQILWPELSPECRVVVSIQSLNPWLQAAAVKKKNRCSRGTCHNKTSNGERKTNGHVNRPVNYLSMLMPEWSSSLKIKFDVWIRNFESRYKMHPKLQHEFALAPVIWVQFQKHKRKK